MMESCLPPARFGNFNSIKVRLEPAFRGPYHYQIQVFQFHKGAIRTAEPNEERFDLDNFNSIKVRLELYCSFNVVVPLTEFQFHKGAIRTHKGAFCPRNTSISIP